MNYSTEQSAKIAQMLGFVLTLFKINLGFDNEQMSQIIGAGIFLVATGYAWIKRYQRGDINILGVRK